MWFQLETSHEVIVCESAFQEFFSRKDFFSFAKVFLSPARKNNYQLLTKPTFLIHYVLQKSTIHNYLANIIALSLNFHKHWIDELEWDRPWFQEENFEKVNTNLLAFW